MMPFDQGLESLYDDNSIINTDGTDEDGEVKYKAIGRCKSKILFVSFTIRDNIERIISARQATEAEMADYWKVL